MMMLPSSLSTPRSTTSRRLGVVLAAWSLVALAPVSAAAQASAPESEPVAPAESAPASVAAEPPLAHGTLEVITEPPGAAVLLDREPKGAAPVRLEQVPVGAHVVTVEVEGQPPRDREEVVQEGVVTRLVVDVSNPVATPPSPPTPTEPRTHPGKAVLGLALAFPWAWLATSAAVGLVVLWAVLWPMRQSELPVVAGLKLVIDDRTWKAVQWSPLVAAAGLAVLALALYVAPAIPLSRWLSVGPVS